MAERKIARGGAAVFVVIPTFNRRQALSDCLQTLRSQSAAVNIVVADAGSSDGAREMLAAAGDVILAEGTPDLWWTGSTNLGVAAALERASAEDFILCLNDDTMVGPDYVERLLAASAPRRLVGSVAVDAADPDRIVDGGVRMNWITAKLRSQNVGRRLKDIPSSTQMPVDVLPGRGTLIPVSLFHEVGRFADQLPHYGADYEFSVRCARAGCELVVSYGAVVRSRTDLTGIHRPRRKGLKDAYAYFLTRRSSCNLRDRAVFAWLTRRSPLQAAAFFAASVARITWRYFQGEGRGPSEYQHGGAS